MFQKYHPPMGSRPGTLAAPPDAPTTQVEITRYDADSVAVTKSASLSEIPSILSGRSKNEHLWVHLEGLGSSEVLLEIGEIFQIHPLALEDAVNVPHRPSIQSFEHQALIVAWTVRVCPEDALPDTAPDPESLEPADWCDPEFAQLAIFFGDRYVVTIAERVEKILEPIRERLQTKTSRMRQLSSDYLAYAILDAVVDCYYPVLEGLGEHLDDLETAAFARPSTRLLHEIHSVRRTLFHLRKGIWPLRDALSTWMHDPGGRLSDSVRFYLRDTHDHCVQLVDVVETYREVVSELLNTYLSAVSQRTNEVMKTLTIMATIFIPLTFLAGLYGMNFQHMPELRWRWSYPVLLVVMLLVVIALLRYFRNRGWLGGDSD